MSDTLIKVENLSKKFCRDLKRSLWYGMKDLGSELFCRTRNGKEELRKDEFWAVQNVSFDLCRGECLGLIGPNGAGKSTLLKLLTGLIKPDEGMIRMRGRVGALIELGAGFNPILTGLENIYINAALLGIPKIRSKIDDIISFAELEDFIHTPVQSYSSGMKVRLGFAIAAQMEPDVLIIDEVLAVGDVGFRSKCFNAIDKISKNAAVIFVSHQMPQIARICSDIIVLNKSTAVYQGKKIPEGIEFYYSQFEGTQSSISGSGKAKIEDIRLFSGNGQKVTDEPLKLNYLDDLIIELAFVLDSSIHDAVVNIAFFDQELRGAAQCYSSNSNFSIINSGNQIRIKVKIKNLQLNPGIYDLSIVIVDGRRGETLINHHGAKKIKIVSSFIGFAPVQFQGEWEYV